MTANEFIAGFLGASPIEIVASVSGFICIFLIIRRNIWCWFFGLIQVTLFSYVFFNAKLYSDAGLHVIYIGLQFYGWWQWRRNTNNANVNGDSAGELIIQRTSTQDLAFWAALSLVTALLLGYIMHSNTDASYPYPDAFTTSTSLVAQWLLSRRHLLNWCFWIVVDIVAIYIYFQKGLYPTSALYFTLLIMCFFGQYSWLKQYKKQLEPQL
jgi:nicotinamide mononucleotide transporter